MTNLEPTDQAAEELDPGMVRAGEAAAARRRELNISQRSLAADGIINAGALIAFEKGRSWPRERTRAKLEKVLEWSPGTIARLRRGESASTGHDDMAVANPDDNNVVPDVVMTAVGAVDTAIESLPNDEGPEFMPRAMKILADLRQLEGIAANAARFHKVSPAAIKALSAVRTRYDGLMLRAARAPHATLGHRLYAARRGANLTIAETAQAAGVSEDDVLAAEAEMPVSATAAAAIESLIGELDWS